MKILVFLLAFGFVPTVFALNYSSEVFEQGSGKTKKLFTFKSESTETDGLETVKSQFKDLEGRVVIEERLTLKGNELIRMELDQNQTQQKGIVEVKDGRIYFTKISEGKEKRSDEKKKDPFVVAGTFQRFVRSQWEDLDKGKEIEFRYGVWDRLETVGFEISKVSEDDKSVSLKMKPSSFIIAAIVRPIHFKFAKDGSKLLEMNGRVAPKKKEGSDWKDLDAEVVYSYP